MSEDPIIALVAAVARMEAKLDSIDKGVNGNGQPGLKQKVEDLEASRNKMYGMGAIVVFFGGIFEWLFHRH